MEAHPGVEEEQEPEAPREGGGEGGEGGGGAGQVIWAGSGWAAVLWASLRTVDN